MAELEKAKLQEVRADENQTPIGDPVSVQFNPSSLRLKLTNQSNGGRTRGRQRRQNNGQSSTVLTMDLIFDTADEGSDAVPVSVRSKTSLVEKFVLPRENSSDAPPLLRFEWDQLIIIGIVEGLEIDFDHFASNGAPLRAKVGLSIKEQDPKYTYLQQGRGQRDANNAQPPGGNNSAATPGGGTNDPGKGSGASSDRSDTALEGETAADFLARQGLDPTAWRGLDVDLSAGLSLEAGVEIGFNASLSAGVGVGLNVGVLAETGVSLQASLGFGASAVLSSNVSASAGAAVSAFSHSSSGTSSTSNSATQQTKKISGDSAGLALSSAGGIRSAIETVKIAETQTAVVATQSAFSAPDSSTPGLASSSTLGSSYQTTNSNRIKRTPLMNRQTVSGGTFDLKTAATAEAVPAVSKPKADPRSTSYGFGVPMRPLYAAALSQQQVRVCSRIDRDSLSGNGPPYRKQKTTAPWVALPQRDQTRSIGDKAELKRTNSPCDYLPHPCKCEG